MVAVAYNPKSTAFGVGDYVRKGNSYSYIEVIDRGDAILTNGKRYWLGELKLIQKAAPLVTETTPALCDICEEFASGVETKVIEDDALNICASCRAASVSNQSFGNSEQLFNDNETLDNPRRDIVSTINSTRQFKRGDWVRFRGKIQQVLAVETLGWYWLGEDRKNAVYAHADGLEPASNFVLVGEGTLENEKTRRLAAQAENTHAVPERLFLPAPKSNEPQTPSQPPPPKIYDADYWGWLDLVVAHADPSTPTVHFVRDYDRSYYVFASEAEIVRDLILPITQDSTGLELKPLDIIPVEINDGDKVDRLVLNDWTPRRVITFGDCMTALLAAGYRVVIADGEKVMKYNPDPLPAPALNDGDEVFYGRDTYKIKGAAVRKADGYWYHLESKYSTEFAPENKIKLFCPNPERWVNHYALMTVRGHQEGRAKPSQEKVVVLELKAGFATIRRGCIHNRIHFCNLTLLDELAAPEELAAPAPTWELARIRQGQPEGVS